VGFGRLELTPVKLPTQDRIFGYQFTDQKTFAEELCLSSGPANVLLHLTIDYYRQSVHRLAGIDVINEYLFWPHRGLIINSLSLDRSLTQILSSRLHAYCCHISRYLYSLGSHASGDMLKTYRPQVYVNVFRMKV
jgi:hypothetical protein